MNYFALLYELVDGMVTRRVPFREEHLRLAREARDRGELVLGGALTDPVDRALLIFHVDNKIKVEAFARQDPYVLNGLVKNWEVRPWAVVVENVTPSSAAGWDASAPATGTIMRRWSARATDHQLPKYLQHFSETVLPELRRVPGYLGATVALRRHELEVEIVVETSWASLESVRNFAGTDLEAGVVDTQAAALLTEFDCRVNHYEIVVTDCN